MSTIPVFHSFARSGGTLVNQLLAVHPQCLVLSEVSPAASYKPVAEQAVEWLGLIEPHEAGEFARLPYHRQIAFLDDRAGKRKKRLVVRDWVTVNFLPGAARDHTIPRERANCVSKAILRAALDEFLRDRFELVKAASKGSRWWRGSIAMARSCASSRKPGRGQNPEIGPRQGGVSRVDAKGRNA